MNSECMPAGRPEVSHCHRKSRQFFVILGGKAADQGKTWTKVRSGSVAENAGM
jgi:hypothetical protein